MNKVHLLGANRSYDRDEQLSLIHISNDFSCHDRAYLIRQELQGFEVFGSLCMNRVHGEDVYKRQCL